MMSVVCKFKVASKTEIPTSDGDRACQIQMRPDYGDSEENKSWSKYTPCGQIDLTITNPAAIDALELGEEYLITFEKI
jgi:hypothetical protein